MQHIPTLSIDNPPVSPSSFEIYAAEGYKAMSLQHRATQLYNTMLLAGFVRMSLIMIPNNKEISQQLFDKIEVAFNQAKVFFAQYNKRSIKPSEQIQVKISDILALEESYSSLHQYTISTINSATDAGKILRVVNQGSAYSYRYDQFSSAYLIKGSISDTTALVLLLSGTILLTASLFTRYSEHLLINLFRLALTNKTLRYFCLQHGFFYFILPITLSLIALGILVIAKHHIVDRFSYKHPGGNAVMLNGYRKETISSNALSNLFSGFLLATFILPPLAARFLYQHVHCLSFSIVIASTMTILLFVLFMLKYSTAQWVEFFTNARRFLGSVASRHNTQVLIYRAGSRYSLFYDDFTQSMTLSRAKELKAFLHIATFILYFLTGIFSIAVFTIIALPTDIFELSLVNKCFILLPLAIFLALAAISHTYLHAKQWKNCDMALPHTSKRTSADCTGVYRNTYTGCKATHVVIAISTLVLSCISLIMSITHYIKVTAYSKCYTFFTHPAFPLFFSMLILTSVLSILVLIPITFTNKIIDVCAGKSWSQDPLCCSLDVLDKHLDSIHILLEYLYYNAHEKDFNNIMDIPVTGESSDLLSKLPVKLDTITDLCNSIHKFGIDCDDNTTKSSQHLNAI